MAKLLKILLGGIIGLVILLLSFFVLMWWGSRIPKRPTNISASGIFIERGSVPFKLSTQGDWLDCWQDMRTDTDRCRLTDEKGNLKFEGIFLSYQTKAGVSESELKIDATRTGNLWIGVTAASMSLPIVFLQNGTILLPQSDYEKAKKFVDFWVYKHGNR